MRPCLPAHSSLSLPAFFRGARSSAVEHHLDMVGVTGSIPVARTTFFVGAAFSKGEGGARLPVRNPGRWYDLERRLAAFLASIPLPAAQ